MAMHTRVNKSLRTLLGSVLIVFMSAWGGVCPVFAQPEVKIALVDPDIRDASIRIDSSIREIKLAAHAAPSGMKVSWILSGSGRFEGESSGLANIYILPDHIPGSSETVTITVTVIDSEGNTATDDIRFTLLAPEPTATPTLKPTFTPTPTPATTATPKPTVTPKPVTKPTPKPTKTPKPKNTSTPRPTPTNTPEPTPTPKPKDRESQRLDELLSALPEDAESDTTPTPTPTPTLAKEKGEDKRLDEILNQEE